MSTEQIRVAFDDAASAYLVTVDGVRAGAAEVILGEDVAVFTHTEIGEEYGGRGLAKVLLAGALADVDARGLAVEARCGFVAAYLAKNPDAARVVG